MSEFTKEQMVEWAQKHKKRAEEYLAAVPNDEYGAKDLALTEIALAALAAQPIGYINRHTGVFHRPESVPSNELVRQLYFPVFGAHALVSELK